MVKNHHLRILRVVKKKKSAQDLACGHICTCIYVCTQIYVYVYYWNMNYGKWQWWRQWQWVKGGRAKGGEIRGGRREGRGGWWGRKVPEQEARWWCPLARPEGCGQWQAQGMGSSGSAVMKLFLLWPLSSFFLFPNGQCSLRVSLSPVPPSPLKQLTVTSHSHWVLRKPSSTQNQALVYSALFHTECQPP